VGINVRVESERGELLAQVLDPYGLTACLLVREGDLQSVCLRFVDPYGDAVFNQLQLPSLADELRRQRDAADDLAVREHADAILHLVESAVDKGHTYIRFVGD
jgi:hypothetical protein